MEELDDVPLNFFDRDVEAYCDLAGNALDARLTVTTLEDLDGDLIGEKDPFGTEDYPRLTSLVETKLDVSRQAGSGSRAQLFSSARKQPGGTKPGST